MNKNDIEYLRRLADRMRNNLRRTEGLLMKAQLEYLEYVLHGYAEELEAIASYEKAKEDLK